MFLGMQDFVFAQIQSNLPKSNHFCLSFSSISPNFTKSNQFCQNLINFAEIIFCWGIRLHPSSFGNDCTRCNSVFSVSHGSCLDILRFMIKVSEITVLRLESNLDSLDLHSPVFCFIVIWSGVSQTK